MQAMIAARPTATEDDITWQLIEEMAVKGAELLLPIFEREQGRKGRLSIQTNPKLYRDPERITEQAIRFAGAGPQHAGEGARHARRDRRDRGDDGTRDQRQRDRLVHGAAGARRRGGRRARPAAARGGGRGHERDAPVCTIMIGRLDDWLKVACRAARMLLTPGRRQLGGHRVLQARVRRSIASAATGRGCLPPPTAITCTGRELIGGDIVLTIPYTWQRLFNASDIEVVPRFDDAVPPAILDELEAKVPDFRRAYEPDGLAGRGIRHVRCHPAHAARLHRLVPGPRSDVRDVMLPNPDKD